ncbi:MAG: GDSL-type esterase/lipase family protein [Terriglobia bacterium]
MSSAVRIMPLGDSITEGFGDEKDLGGYRGPLFQLLTHAGLTVDFVGSAKPVGNIPDPDHEGHSGHTARELIHDPATNKGVFEWLQAATPEIVLLHAGTNNIIRGERPEQIAGEIAELLNEIDRYETFSHTTVTVVLAKIITNPSSLLALARTAELNGLIEKMAAARIAAGDRLTVADFGNILVFPGDFFVASEPVVHPSASGYGKMAPVWFDALSRVLSNRIVPAGGYTLDILTGLAVDRNGILEMTSVVDVEYWKPLVPISGPIFTPGAPVAMAKQTDGILTALAVDKDGRLVVASVGGAGIWQTPVGISSAIFPPGAPVAMAKQTDGILTALAVDKDGRLVVASVAGLGAWKLPVSISETIFKPGTPVAMAKQTDGILTALAVDKNGRLVVTSVAGTGHWQQHPVGISDTIFLPGTPVAMAKQTDGILTALAVDKDGHLVVTSVAGTGHWQQHPVGISDTIFLPGTPVAMAKQTDGILTALAVDKDGRLVVTSVAGTGHWQQHPVGISDTIFKPGTPVAMAKQTKGILTALLVDKDGRLVVTSVAGTGHWQQQPVGISSAIFNPGAHVALTKQIDGVNLAAFLNAHPQFSGSPLAQRIGQLTGDGLDPEYRHLPGALKQVVNATGGHGVVGVDLGANIEFDGKIVFFFGDVPTAPGRPDDQSDWVAFHPAGNRLDSPAAFGLISVDGANGRFHPFSIQGIGPLGIGQTPTGAFSYPGEGSGGTRDQAWVFAFYYPADLANAPEPRGSLLTKSNDPTQPVEFSRVFSFSTFDQGSGRFFQVAPWVVDNAKFPGVFPSSEGDGLVLIGQGGPANSVHLAWMPLEKGSDPRRSAIRYYSGGQGTNAWSGSEGDARDLFFTIGYTSLSLAWIPEAKRWLLLYTLASPGAIPLNPDRGSPNQHNPNGPVVARLGKTPWDWTDEIIIFDPLRDNALGRFMHRPGDDLDQVPPVLPPDFNLAYGGEVSYAYGPFLLNRYTKWDANARELTIYYLLSTFRPYQVQVMQSQFHVA